MKVFCGGSEHYINQIDRIRSGFIENGCELVSLEEADIIYFNDPHVYDLDAKNKNTNAKVIFNVLDLPPHCIDGSKYDISRYPYINGCRRDYNPEVLAAKLKKCDIATCICEEVQWQLKNWCGVDSIVIYNPIKDVSFLNLNADESFKNDKGELYKYLYVGRANDPNKRFNIVYETMKILGDKPDSLAVIGSENPRWGDYYSVVKDDDLNLFYNSVEYLFFPSAFKSIGLPALESVVTKTKTIVCNDDPTTNEFWQDIGVSSNPEEIAGCIKNTDWNLKVQEFVNLKSEEYKIRFDKKTIAANIISLIC